MSIISKVSSVLNLDSLFSVKDGLSKEDSYSLFLRKPLSDYLLPSAYDENLSCYILKDNTIGMIFECFPKPAAGIDTIKILQGLYSAMYLPANSIIQVTLWGSDYIEPFVAAFRRYRQNGQMDIPSEVWMDSMTDFMMGQKRHGPFDEMPVPLRNYRLFFSFKLPFDFSEYEAKSREIESIYRNVKTSLESAYFFPENVLPDHYIKIASLIFNPNHSRSLKQFYDPGEYIHKQIILSDTDTHIEKNCIKYDGVYGKALSIKQYPEEFSVMDTFSFIGDKFKNELQISCPFVLTLNVIKSGDKLKHEQEQKAEFLYKQKLASSLSVKLEKKQDESKWVIEKLVEGNRLLKGFLVWWLYHDNLEVVLRNAETVKNLLEIKNFKLQEEIRTMNLASLLYSILPLSLSYDIEEKLLKRSRTMFDFNAAHLSPVQADWKGTGTPIVKFVSRRGQDISFDFFDGSEGYNAVIAAMTGSGKSFVTNHIINSYYPLPDLSNIWVIDIGESYKNLCQEVLNGVYLDFREDADIVINPFSECDNINEDMDLFVALISKMSKPTENITDTEKAVIEEAISLAFAEYENDTNIDRLIEVLNRIAKSSPDLPKKNAAIIIATNLYRWSSQGSYGKFFNGKNNIDLSHKFVVLELKNISHREDLRNVILMVLFYHISNIIYISDKKSMRKLLIFDESWQFKDDPKICKFMEKAARTFRKHYSSLVLVTQSVDDMYSNEHTRNIMLQSSYWLLMRQKPEAINLLKKDERVVLSEYDFQTLESIRTIKGKYSEIFFVTPAGKGEGRLIVPRPLYWTYSTDAVDVSRRKVMIEQYGFKEGINKCIEQYG